MFTLFTNVAHAAGNAAANKAVDSILKKITDNIVTPLVELIFALAVMIFIWGVYQYMISSCDPAKKTEGAQHILWGVVGMLVMISVYGIMRLIFTTVGVDNPPF